MENNSCTLYFLGVRRRKRQREKVKGENLKDIINYVTKQKEKVK